MHSHAYMHAYIGMHAHKWLGKTSTKVAPWRVTEAAGPKYGTVQWGDLSLPFECGGGYLF